MDVNTRNRNDLKTYFVKNSIPTESNFADLIDGMLNQNDDGLVKLDGSPLSIEGVGDADSQNRTLNFYRSFADDQLDWTLSLNPRSRPQDASTARLGFSIDDGEGNSRLFIDRTSGNVGIGTLNTLTVLALRGNGGTNDVGITQKQVGGNSTMELTTADAAGNQATRLLMRGGTDTAHFEFYSGARGAEQQRLMIDGSTGNLGIGTAPGGHSLNVSGRSIKLGLEGNGGGQLILANNANDNKLFIEAFSRDGAGHAAELLLTGRHGQNVPRLTLFGDIIRLNGNVGIGETNAAQQLVISGNHNQGKDSASGLQYGGSVAIKGNAPQIDFIDTNHKDWSIHVNSDRLYFIREPWEADDLVLDGAGNVGIGTRSPAAKLQVTGDAIVNNVFLGNVGHGGTWAGFAHKDSVSTVGYSLLHHSGGTYTLINKKSGGGYIALRIDNVNQVVLDDKGNLGIGTDTPSAKLQVVGGIDLSGNIRTGKGFLQMGGSASSGEVVGGVGFLGYGVQHGMLAFRAGSGFEMIDPSRDGPRLNFNRDSYPYADLKVRNLAQASSREFKENITAFSVQEAVAVLEGLNPVTFHYKDDTASGRQVGFVAEDVPDLIASQDGTGVMTHHVVTVLTQVVKAQQKAIATLTRKLESLID